MDNQQLSAKSVKNKYKIGEIIGDLEIIELFPKKTVCKVKCLLCGYIYITSISALSARKKRVIHGCKKCWQQLPLKKDRYKYHKGELIGDYELIEPYGKNEGLWKAKCTKCGKEQIIRIPNAKKRVTPGCSFCDTRIGRLLPKINNTKKSSIIYSLDERSYRTYKKKIEVFNKHQTRKFKEFTLSLDDWKKLIHGNCYYCGAKPTADNYWNKGHNVRKTNPEIFYANGIDRIDSSKGYTPDNCVSCCPICNRMKLDLKVNDWITHMHKILAHLSESSTTIPEGSTSEANADGNGDYPNKDKDIV